GDVDAFRGDFASLKPETPDHLKSFRCGSAEEAELRRWDREQNIHGIIVVHPAAALRALEVFGLVGVFENANRAPEGEKPTFEPVALHIWRDDTHMDGAFRALIHKVAPDADRQP